MTSVSWFEIYKDGGLEMKTYLLKTWKDFPRSLRRFQNLILAAIAARKSAYAPYSKFSVGAAVYTTETPDIFSGCNVENAIFEVTHAEQLALANAVLGLRGKKATVTEVAIALIAPKDDQHAVPCGLCRQWIREFGTPKTKIIGVKMKSHKSECPWAIEVTSLGALLPHDFGPQNLVK